MADNSFLYRLSRYLNHYLPYTAGVSPNTIKAYGDSFKLLFTFAKEHDHLKPDKITFAILDREFVLAFDSWLAATRNSSDRTRDLRIGHIKTFFTYVQTEMPEMVLQAQNILKIPKKRLARPIVDYITPEGIRLILDQPDRQRVNGKKHYVLLSFLYATGARVQEVADATIEDFRYNHSDSVRLTGKGNKARLVPLEKSMMDLMTRYVEYEREQRTFADSTMPLFLNHSGHKLTRQGITHIVKKYAVMAREHNSDLIPEKVHPHTFRHSRAMAMLQAGVELIYIRDFLGHYSVTTTEIYARTSNALTKKALQKVASQSNDTSVPIWHSDKELLSFLKSL